MKRVLNKYVDVSGQSLGKLADEILFYLRFIELERKLKEHSMSCCIGETSEVDTILTDFYNIKLAICHMKGEVEEEIICNDIEFTKKKLFKYLRGQIVAERLYSHRVLDLLF